VKAIIEASAGTGKTYELTTIVAAAIAGPELLDPAQRGSGLIDGAEFSSLLAAGPLRASEIVLVTYTEAATRELHGRVRGRLAALRRQLSTPGAEDAGAASLDADASRRAIGLLSTALSEIDAMPISTIHGFCERVKREHGFELGLGGARRELIEESVLAEELAMRWWSRRVRDDEALGNRCRVAGLDRAALASLAREAISSRGVEMVRVRGAGVEAIAAELMDFARQEMADLCASRGAATYQDMPLALRDGLRLSARLGELLRGRHRLGVIDEAQDTDPVQLEIFERLFDRSRSDAPPDEPATGRDRLLVVVGDPKQSIYGFRGADLDAYLRLRGSQTPRRLDTNRRSEAGVVEAVNAIFARPRPFERDGIEHPPVHAEEDARHGTLAATGSAPRPAAVELHQGAEGGSEIEWCVRMVQDLMDRKLVIATKSGSRPLRWRDMAVLGRSNGKLAKLALRLRAAGVPAILLGDRTVFESEAAADLAAVLAACAEPGRARLVRRAMVSALIGVDAARLVPGSGDALVEAWTARLSRWADAARRGGALAIVERAIAESARPVDARVQVDSLHLAELLHGQVGASVEARTLASVLDRLVAASRTLQTRPGDPRRRRIERDDAVTLRTMHTAKGLEFGVVLLPWAGDSIISRGGHQDPVTTLRLPASTIAGIGEPFEVPPGASPDESVLVPLTADGPGGAVIEQRTREEALRLFYVAVTRARHSTLLFEKWSARSKAESVPELLDIHSRANGRTLCVIHDDAVAAAPPRPAGDMSGSRAGAAKARSPDTVLPSSSSMLALPTVNSARRSLGRPIELWIDTNFSRLSASASSDGMDAIDTMESLSAPAPLAVRDDEPAPVITRSEIAGGVHLGRLVHRVFEWASLEGPGADLDAIVAEALKESGVTGRFDPDTLQAMAAHTRGANLASIGGPGITIGAIDPAHMAVELEFCLPMGHERPLSAARLAAAMAKAPAGTPSAIYAPIVSRLAVGEITGFLRGTIDLLFRHQGRWWIVDYKSNDLGERDDDYRGASLLDAMVRGQYILQYLLYAMAARRLLLLRGATLGPDWFGGAIYPFVRGVDAREPGRGLFIDRPPPAVIDAIDAMLRMPAVQGASA